jgi:hypothetical protein
VASERQAGAQRGKKRPSFADAFSTLALFLVLAGGTAFAASHYLGAKGKHHHYVVTKTKQFKPSVIAALKADRGATGPTGPVGGTGPTGPANPSAATLDGQTLTKFFFKAPENTGSTQLFSGDGLTLNATCSSGGDPGLTATSTDGDAELNVNGDRHVAFFSGEFAALSGTHVVLDPTVSDNEGSMVLAYGNTSGQTVTITLGFDYTMAFGNYVGCGIWGTATQS